MDTSNEKITRTPCNWETPAYIENAVKQFMLTNPEAYKRAQEYGEFLMNLRLADIENPIEKKDIEGDKILLDKLKRDINHYGIKYEELLDHEKRILHENLSLEEIDILFSQNLE